MRPTSIKNIFCPHCGTHLEVSPETLDCEIQCPSCENDFVVSQELVQQGAQVIADSAKQARAKRARKRKLTNKLLALTLLIILGAGLYVLKIFYDKYQQQQQEQVLALAKKEEAKKEAAEKAKREEWQKRQDLARQAKEEKEARLKSKQEAERLAEENRLKEERLEKERLAEEKRLAEEERLAEEKRLKEERLAEAKLKAKIKAWDKKVRLAKKRQKSSRRISSQVVDYKPEIGSKKHNQEMTNADAQRIQDKLQVFTDTDSEVLEKKIKGMRYHNQCLISPLGQLGGHGVAIRRDEGLYLYRLDPKGLLAQAGLKEWDLITAVNSKKLDSLDSDIKAGEGPIVTFGRQLDISEGKGGKFVLTVQREGKKKKDITIKVQKRYSFPDEQLGLSNKGESLLKLSLRILDEVKKPDYSWPSGYNSRYSTFQIPLAFLSSGDRSHSKLLKKTVYTAMDLDHYEWSWGIGMKTILMAEYFWATGDMKVYEELQELADRLTDYINPTGGVAQKFNQGTYGGTNFGPTSTLTCLALSLSEKCGIAFNHVKRKQQFENYTANPKGFIAGYGGYLSGNERNLGERGFTTSAIGLALAIDGSEKALIKNVTNNLSANYKELAYIHATPSQGLIFGSMALARLNPKAFAEFQDYFRWHLTIAHLPDNNLFFVKPRQSRMAIPGGGGWNGCSILGFEQMACLQIAMMLTADRKNLLMTGNEQPGWLTANRTVLKDAREYQKERVKNIFSEARKALSRKELRKAYDKLAYIQTHYPETKYIDLKKLDYMLRYLKKQKEWAKIAKELKEEEAQVYYDWARQLRDKTRIKYLEKFMELFPDSPLVEDAKRKITETTEQEEAY